MGFGWVRWAVPVGALLALLAFFVVAGSPSAAGGCSLSLTVGEPVVDAKITSTQPGAATTSVKVAVEIPPFQNNTLVQLTGQVESGWPLSISPSSISYGSSAYYSSPVKVTVVVPPGETAQNATVTLDGRLLVDGVLCSQVTVDEPTVRVLPYVQAASLVASQSLFEPEGTRATVSVPLSFTARANGDVELEVNYSFPPEVQVEGPDHLTLPVERGEVGSDWEIQVTSRDGRPGVFEVTVTVSARVGGVKAAETNTTLFLQVDEGLLNVTTAPIVVLAFAGFAAAAAWFFYVGFLRDRERGP